LDIGLKLNDLSKVINLITQYRMISKKEM